MLSVAMLFLFSCKKNANNVENDTINDLTIRSKVARLGFDTTNMVMKGDTIIVEGDVILTKSNLIKTSPRQASSIDLSTTVYPISYSRHRNLKYYISSTVSSWESSIDDAISKYNNLSNFNLRFDRTTNVNEADLQFIYDSSLVGSGTVARAAFPSNGNIGNIIKIGSAANFNNSQKTFVMTHEIGHTIGFRHTNWRIGETESGVVDGVLIGAYTIPGTLNYSNSPDPNSIFNSGSNWPSGPPNWPGFSSFDLIALRYLYPKFGPVQFDIDPSGVNAVHVGQIIRASVNVEWREGGLIYEWASQGATITKNNGNSIEAVVTDVNSAAVACMIRNSHGEAIGVSKSYGPYEID